ncbi:MAG: DUF1109 family protein [Alphaproteobacteria bacterium]|nr:DUF1109 family protein [Alphaproteobacteria bacterium]
MASSEQTTESLIDSLSCDLKSVKKVCHPAKCVLPWCLYAVAYVAAVIYFLGFRRDIEEQLSNPVFLYEILQVFAISMSAAFCAVWLRVPDMRGQQWMLMIPITLFISFVTWIFLKVVTEEFLMPTIHWHHCHQESLIIGVVPAIAIWFLSSRGATTRPYMTTFMNVLAVGGLGYIGLRISCGADNMGHISFFHLLPYVVIGIIAAALTKRIFKW